MFKQIKNQFKVFLPPWLGLLFGLAMCCLMTPFFSENPIHVFKVLVSSGFQSKYDFGLTLYYTTCLIFTGLAFAIPLRAGLFHIGSEGQLTVSAMVAGCLGSTVFIQGSEFSILFSTAIVFLTSLATGILAAGIIAAFKYYRGSHEVVIAIMLNFIFSAFSLWLTVNYYQNPESQNPESGHLQKPLQFLINDPLKVFFEQSPVSLFFIFAILSCGILFFIESKMTWLQQINAYGKNSIASQRQGFSELKILILSMGLAGFFSGCVGLTEVFGNSMQYKIGFSPLFGFLGIAVSLLARQNFLGLIFSAFLMATLHKGASDLDLETQFLTRDFSKVLQAVIIFSVASSYYLFQFLNKSPQNKSPQKIK